MMPMPAVITASTAIHLRTPSMPDQTNGSSPFFGDNGTASGYASTRLSNQLKILLIILLCFDKFSDGR